MPKTLLISRCSIKKNHLPVENAFLFFENTTSGFQSDSAGNVTIILPKGNPTSLVITHILYETIVLQDIDLLREDQIIYLSEKDTTNRNLGSGRWVFLDHADWIPEEANGINLLSKISPLRRYYAGGAENKIYSIITNHQGEEIYVPIQIVIDGMGAEPGGSSAQRFYGLSADMIESIYISEAYVGITTRKISRTRERYLDSGIIHLDHPGYYKTREFSTNNMISKLSSQSTVYWDPSVNFDEGGQINIDLPEICSPCKIDLQGISESGKIINYQKSVEAK